MSEIVAWRFAVVAFVVASLFLGVLAGLWLHWLWGPEISFYDLGAPQLRAGV